MSAPAPQHPLAAGVVGGSVRALARACRLADDAVGEHRAILKQIFPHTGNAWTIGVTGSPGSGKSTLTDKLIGVFRAKNARVGVVAIDPTSPFSGGAILGDRIRMQRHHGDPEVFIRSLATRGALGGLSRSAADVIRLVDAWKADVILVETVGVGQDELEVTRTVDTTLVVMAPGMGDEVQAIKAGILECADVFAVNKADREGADTTVRDLELMIMLGQMHLGAAESGGHRGGHHGGPEGKCGGAVTALPGVDASGAWQPPIVRTVATRGEGIDELCARLDEHRVWLTSSEKGRARRRERLGQAMRQELRSELLGAAEARMHEAIEEAVERVERREIDPYTAAEDLVTRFRAG
jgi:LAO/AO transport system kinase